MLKCPMLTRFNKLSVPIKAPVWFGALFALSCLTAACSGPNHVGNPLTLPVRGLASAVENGAYNRERAGVKAWITENETAMRAEGFGGPVTESLLATLPVVARDQARRDFLEAAGYSDFTERATVVVMVFRD